MERRKSFICLFNLFNFLNVHNLFFNWLYFNLQCISLPLWNTYVHFSPFCQRISTGSAFAQTCFLLFFPPLFIHSVLHGARAALPPGGQRWSRRRPLGSSSPVKMATGVLHRVGSGLGRATSRAQTAGQLVVWTRWGGHHCGWMVVLSVVCVVCCGCALFLFVCVSWLLGGASTRC